MAKCLCYWLTVCQCQTCAENALELHGRELEPGFSMNVFISNPERKKERTDHDANDREIYIAGLSKFTNKADLEKLFKTVRYPLDSYLLTPHLELPVWNYQGSQDG